ncbi:hypothetical protein D3C71_2043890 [compost metagenome]
MNKQDNQRQDQDFTQHGANLWFENFVEDTEAKSRHHRPGQLAHAAKHHHQEGVDDITLPQLGPDVAQLRQGYAAQPGNAGP